MNMKEIAERVITNNYSLDEKELAAKDRYDLANHYLNQIPGYTENKLGKLKELADKLPVGLRSDWEYTNHWELTGEGKDFWWLDLNSIAKPHNEEYFDANNPEHQKIGLLMDIAEEVRKLIDSGVI